MAPSPADYMSYYSALGVHSRASTLEIRNAYRSLAMKWHPDKCRKEDAAQAEASKMKFQGIQEAFSVLSDERKRTLYDIGLYDPDDDEEDSEGLRGFIGELSALMAEVKAESEEMTSFKDLQQLFLSMFSADPMMCGFGSSARAESCTNDKLDVGSCYGRGTKLATDSEGLLLGYEE